MVHSVTCENDAKPRVDAPQAVGTDAHLVAARLKSHLKSSPSKFADMDPEAILEIAHYLIEYRDSRTQTAIGEDFLSTDSAHITGQL